jgi:hypothetical protein
MVTIRVFNTPIKIKLVVLVNVIALWAATSLIGRYFHPERDLPVSILIGFFAMLLLLIADIGHAIGHIFSARRSGAPMQEILVSSGMPRTIYSDDDITPSAHIMRALGGPAFSAIGLLLSLVALGLSSSVPIAFELALWSTVGHGFIFLGCLLPLPIVDGGSILKWSLVRRGMTAEEADRRLLRVNSGVGLLGFAAGIVLLALKLWVVGLLCIVAGVFFIAVAMGWIL